METTGFVVSTKSAISGEWVPKIFDATQEAVALAHFEWQTDNPFAERVVLHAITWQSVGEPIKEGLAEGYRYNERARGLLND